MWLFGSIGSLPRNQKTINLGNQMYPNSQSPEVMRLRVDSCKKMILGMPNDRENSNRSNLWIGITRRHKKFSEVTPETILCIWTNTMIWRKSNLNLITSMKPPKIKYTWSNCKDILINKSIMNHSTPIITFNHIHGQNPKIMSLKTHLVPIIKNMKEISLKE